MNRWCNFILLAIAFLFLSATTAFGQQTSNAIISGTLTDGNNNPIEGATIAILGSTQAPVYTDKNGHFEYTVPAGKQLTLVMAGVGFKREETTLTPSPGQQITLNKQLKASKGVSIDTVVITDHTSRVTGVTTLNPKLLNSIPSSSGDINVIVFSQMGVSNRNELSSAYSVRGGNYDENLVYVNDIEVYRPFLVRSGQQEGLSFANPDMVSSLSFSAGGFEAKYGDKMSSVLDIKYRRPRSFAGTVSGSILGGNLHLEGATKDLRFTWLLGARYRTTRYLLNTLDTKGDYLPSFTDIQSYFTYDITDKFEINVLGNFASNNYLVIPQNRETDFGTVNQALRLKIYFDGKENDRFTTTMGAVSGIYRPNNQLNLKWIVSGYRSIESENYDIQGQYFIDELEADFGKPNFGEVKANRGIGTFLNHARNTLDAIVGSAEHKGTYTNGKNQWLWGAKIQYEDIYDRLSEWKYLDSAGYSLPYYPLNRIDLQDVVKSRISLVSSRASGYVERMWNKQLKDTSELTITAGIRANYWDLNKETVISPRATMAWKPNWKRDFLFRLSAGFYYQPPFYRELRDIKGIIHPTVKAQRSIHFLAGGDYNFKAWNRPFKFVTEAYYKQLDYLNTYEIDNVRIRYFANNNTAGYARGIDFKINGEFVKDEESWVSLSFLQTIEDVKDDYYYDYYNSSGEKIIPGYTFNSIRTDSIRHEPGYIPRPTDQLINFGMFFQDHIPKLPAFKMHLSLFFGSSLPFGPPDHSRYKDTIRMPPYRRVDIGFSYQLIKEGQKLKSTNVFRHLKSAWVSLEVFNLLQVNNTVSYLWIKDVTNRQYAIPNYLTARQLNLKLVVKF